MSKSLRIALIVLSVLGILIMAYLFKVGYMSGDNSFCNLGEGFSCDLVNKSKYAKIFGIPLSGMGLLYFAWVLYMVVRSYKPETLEKIVLATIAILVPSLYLSYIEYFVLKSICILCETSKLVMFAVIGVSYFALRPNSIAKKTVVGGLVLGLLFTGVAVFAHNTGGPGDTYNEFAQCLHDKGFAVLGSKTCASCLKQREMFGEAFHFIDEYECDPRNVKTSEEEEEMKFCETFQIKKTPTWVQLDESRNTLYRFESGIQSFASLSEVSGCALPAGK
ncbi:MAG: vitamin K epoxide reductase family protein [bacterium]|nr:vitamin K epoxide reductase family protein [bacterium]